jgi:hypothetical protein
MRSRISQIILLCILASLIGCGGSGGPGGGGSTSITFTFSGTFSGASLQTGTGTFAPATLQNNQLNFTLSSTTAKYAVAWVCLDLERGGAFETVFEATPQDGTAYVVPCPASGPVPVGPTPTPTAATGTGSVDASAIPGVDEVVIFGNIGGVGSVNAAVGSFNFGNFVSGTNDIAVVAGDSATNTGQAVKIIRGQTLPGAINGGNTITLGPDDLFGSQPLSIPNVPAGFSAPLVQALYSTATGTSFGILTTSTQYQTVPAASTQSGDSYVFFVSTSDTNNSTMGIRQTITNGVGPLTIGPLPDPWTYSGPAPAALPTFTFDSYTGLPGQAVSESASIGWDLPAPFPQPQPGFLIKVSASASYLNGARPPITIPNLVGLPGFSAVSPPPSGTNISWGAGFGAFANGLLAGVGTGGSYPVP